MKKRTIYVYFEIDVIHFENSTKESYEILKDIDETIHIKFITEIMEDYLNYFDTSHIPWSYHNSVDIVDSVTESEFSFLVEATDEELDEIKTWLTSTIKSKYKTVEKFDYVVSNARVVNIIIK